MHGRAVAALLLLAVACGCGRGSPEYEPVSAQSGFVRFPLAVVADGGVHFFTYHHDGVKVNIFIRTDGNGRLHSHLDACYSCFKYRLGFVVEDAEMVCIACRMAYRIEAELWDYIGACAPIPIHSSVDGDELVVEERLLRQAAEFF